VHIFVLVSMMFPVDRFPTHFFISCIAGRAAVVSFLFAIVGAAGMESRDGKTKRRGNTGLSKLVPGQSYRPSACVYSEAAFG